MALRLCVFVVVAGMVGAQDKPMSYDTCKSFDEKIAASTVDLRSFVADDGRCFFVQRLADTWNGSLLDRQRAFNACDQGGLAINLNTDILQWANRQLAKIQTQSPDVQGVAVGLFPVAGAECRPFAGTALNCQFEWRTTTTAQPQPGPATDDSIWENPPQDNGAIYVKMGGRGGLSQLSADGVPTGRIDVICMANQGSTIVNVPSSDNTQGSNFNQGNLNGQDTFNNGVNTFNNAGNSFNNAESANIDHFKNSQDHNSHAEPAAIPNNFQNPSNSNQGFGPNGNNPPGSARGFGGSNNNEASFTNQQQQPHGNAPDNNHLPTETSTSGQITPDFHLQNGPVLNDVRPTKGAVMQYFSMLTLFILTIIFL